MTTIVRARRAAVAGVLIVAVTAVGTSATAAPDQDQGESDAPADYIITLAPETADVEATAEDQLEEHAEDSEPEQVFESALNGFTAELTPDEASSLESEPGVLSVEPDGQVWLTDTQADPPWGVDRTDQRDLPLSGDYSWTAPGDGVTAYIIDSGIRTTHDDFGGRASIGTEIVEADGEDCIGHGTHVASTVGGETHGVAKGASLVSVRVFGCESFGDASDVIAGVDWVAANRDPGEPAVVNMSLSYLPSPGLDAAVQNLIDDGVTVSIAAGNGLPLIGTPIDACLMSPARVPDALTVAASDADDNMASFSNRGPCVDLIAPGVEVPGAWHTSDDATADASGTSMSAPHVTGAAAKALEVTPDATPAEVEAGLTGTATLDRISGTGGLCFFGLCLYPETANVLLYSDL